MRKTTEILTHDDLSDLEFELQRNKEAKQQNNHYVNNKQLFAEFVKYHDKKMVQKNKHIEKVNQEFGIDSEAQLDKLDKETRTQYNKAMKAFTPPPLTDKIGKAIVEISNRRCYSPRFINYAPNWKEEMINDAIETCVKYAHNFDPEKSQNPFSYLTQFVNNAIFQRLKYEHRQQYIKYKMFDNTGGFSGDFDENNVNEEEMDHLNETSDLYNDRLEYIEKFERLSGISKERKKRVPTNMKNLSNILNDIDIEGLE